MPRPRFERGVHSKAQGCAAAVDQRQLLLPVVFSQAHTPGRIGAFDFTHCEELGVTIVGVIFVHLMFQFVLAWSGWRYLVHERGDGPGCTGRCREIATEPGGASRARRLRPSAADDSDGLLIGCSSQLPTKRATTSA